MENIEWKVLFPSFAINRSLKKLNLMFNDLGKEETKILCKYMKKNTSIEDLSHHIIRLI